MKREFLQNFKVSDQPLPKELIDAILDEHSRSIGAIKAEKESLATQLQTAKDGLKAFEGVDVKELQGQITKLQQDLADKDTAHKTELANMAFDRALEGAITAAKGRNPKAIKALLDVDTLKASKNQEADIKTALEGLQKESGYLFDTDPVPPNFPQNTGVQNQQPTASTDGLAGALRERYDKKG